MKSLLFCLIVIGMVISVNADSFEGIDNGNSILLEINDEKATATMRIDGKMNSISGDIRYYEDGRFKLKSDSNERILLFGIPLPDESFKIIHLDLNERKKTIIEVQKLRIQTIHEVVYEREFTPLFVEKKSEIVKAPPVIPPSEYIEDKKREIAILDQTMKRVATTGSFNFDIRVVDADKNNLYSYSKTDGFIDDAKVVSIIKDNHGIIINEFTGTTSNKGHYSPQDVTYFNPLTFTDDPFSLEVFVTAYFEDTATYATASLFKEFFVIYHYNEKKAIVDVYPPIGTIKITKIVGLFTDTLTPELTLACADFDKFQELQIGDCSKMAFAINSTDFSNSTLYDYTETFTYPEPLLNNTYHKIYVQFTDNSPRGNKSVEEIFDDVIPLILIK